VGSTSSSAGLGQQETIVMPMKDDMSNSINNLNGILFVIVTPDIFQ
jgi:hypothetical protein